MDVHAGPLTHFPAHYCVGLAHNVDVPRDVNVPVGADKQYEKQEYAHCKIPGESVRAFVEGRVLQAGGPTEDCDGKVRQRKREKSNYGCDQQQEDANNGSFCTRHTVGIIAE
jgi:hypothetical protein